MLTQNQMDRVSREYAKLAGDQNIEVKFISGTLYLFGSELACLRVFYSQKEGRVGYSENMKSWYYTSENTELFNALCAVNAYTGDTKEDG